VATFDLAAIARRVRNPRRPSITIRDILPPATLATNLYQAAYAPLIAMWRRYAERITAEYGRLTRRRTSTPRWLLPRPSYSGCS
jgi:hypothetical protein